MGRSRLSPSQKARKYCLELHSNQKVNIRTAEYVGSLSDKEKAYRLGYVKARSEASKARQAYFKKHCIK